MDVSLPTDVLVSLVVVFGSGGGGVPPIGQHDEQKT